MCTEYTPEDAYLEASKEARKAGMGAWSDYYHTVATELLLRLPLPQNRVLSANRPCAWLDGWVPRYPTDEELRAEEAADKAYLDRMEAEYEHT